MRNAPTQQAVAHPAQDRNTRAVGLGIVRIVGTGLLGTSVGLALAKIGVWASLDDISEHALGVAVDLGAGERGPASAEPDLIIVAAPPDAAPAVIESELRRHPGATVTDVASVKGAVLQSLRDHRVDTRRYVPGHPMAGRERSGPLAAQHDLFENRPWVICPNATTDRTRLEKVVLLTEMLGARAVTMSPSGHDRAVALVSHLPQVVSSLVAIRLQKASVQTVALAGQAVRDITRVAASETDLWVQILSANASSVVKELLALRQDLDSVIDAMFDLSDHQRPGPAMTAARNSLSRVLVAGREGQARLPGKDGGAPASYEVVHVRVPDEPGAIGELLVALARVGVNLEEFSLEQLSGSNQGVLALSVLPQARPALEFVLDACAWRPLN